MANFQKYRNDVNYPYNIDIIKQKDSEKKSTIKVIYKCYYLISTHALKWLN